MWEFSQIRYLRDLKIGVTPLPLLGKIPTFSFFVVFESVPKTALSILFSQRYNFLLSRWDQLSS